MTSMRPIGSALRCLTLLFLTFLLAGCTGSGVTRPPSDDGHTPSGVRIGELRERLPEFKEVKGWTVAGDFEFRWTAYFEEDTLRLIREVSDMGELGVTEFEYWFKRSGLFAYRASGSRLSGERGGERRLRALAIRAAFDSSGNPVDTAKTMDGERVPLQPREITAAQQRASVLVLEVARTIRASLPPPLRLRTPGSAPGRLAVTDGVLRFTPCGEPAPGITLEDLPGGEAKHMLERAGPEGLTVCIRHDGTRLSEIRYAAGEGPDCSGLPPEGDLLALGNEPFWSVRIEKDSAWLRAPESTADSVVGGGEWSRPGDDRWVFRAGTGLTLELTETPCTDNMSGARRPYTAVAHIGGRRLAGCAQEGRNAGIQTVEERADSLYGLLVGTSWRLETMGGAAVLQGTEPTLEFPERGRIEGNCSCNGFFGKMQVTADGVRFGPLGVARAACAEDVLSQERRYIMALENTLGCEVEGSVLILRVRGAGDPLRFIRR